MAVGGVGGDRNGSSRMIGSAQPLPSGTRPHERRTGLDSTKAISCWKSYQATVIGPLDAVQGRAGDLRIDGPVAAVEVHAGHQLPGLGIEGAAAHEPRRIDCQSSLKKRFRLHLPPRLRIHCRD